MRFLFCLVLVSLFSSCKESNEQSTGEAIWYPYTNQMMDNSIEKGETYAVHRQEHYQANQIVVLDYVDRMEGKTNRMAYRIVGVPGDTVSILKGTIYKNGKAFALPSTAKYHYSVYLKKQDEQLYKEFDMQQDAYSKRSDAFLTKADSNRLVRQFGFIIDSMVKEPLGFNYHVLLNFQNTFGWDTHNFGPVAVPNVGSVVSVDFAVKLLNDTKKEQLSAGSVKVEQPYYFVIGDNFDNCSSDSRSIGLISQSQIVGSLKMD